ncbi:hypothetical protein PsorP6_016661 [Peronosclerospora sorghi]|uniref:Uncharacterized protein n=1 Tax=Peronosclerospora sorghi TaxID=230839 RepID=A0ACC0VR46_9STRA|nr:hypothetical protein PsorP6_016661 [Peronosclerospora sorghi]
MSNGVGFTVFQVPGAKTPKRSTASRLGGGPVLSSASSSSNLKETYTTSSSSASVASSSSGSTPLTLQRGRRNSGTTFAAFQPPGTLTASPQISGITTSVGVPYAGTSGSMGSQSSTSSNSGMTVPMGVGIGFKASGSDDEQLRGGASWMRTGRIIRVKDSGDSFRFPLDNDHLPSTNVSAEQFEKLKTKLQSIAETHVQSPTTWLDNPTLSLPYRNQIWKPHLEKKNCVIYRQKEATESSSLMRKALVRAKLDTSLEELVYAIHSTTTEDQRMYMAHCYQENFLDSAVLQVHERASTSDPFQFMGIKWLALQSSVDSVFSCRDVLVAEFSKTMEDSKGQKVLVRVQESISISDTGGSERNFGFARTSGVWVWLFRSIGASSGKVDVSVISEDRFDGNRSTPSWFANRVVSTLYSVAIHHATAADAKFLVRSRMITDKTWVPNNERPACSVCFKSFNLLRSRHHCRVCAEIMCSACTIELGIQASKLPSGMLPETGNSFIVSVEKFCLKCINKARQERLSLHAASNLDDEAYASRSSEVYIGQLAPARSSMSDHNGDKDLQSLSFASSSSSTSSIGGTSGSSGDKSGILYAGWSTKVLSAINRDKQTEERREKPLLTLTSTGSSRNLDTGAPRVGRQGLNDRRRHNSDASTGSTGISGSRSDEKSRKMERDIATNPVVLLENPSEVQDITPLPTSFTKMEEQIAAQQAILRSMFIEGKKIMEQQQFQSGPIYPAQQPRYVNRMQLPPSVDDKGTFALPSSASIEYID